jgi:hypothetical protein
LFIDYRAARAYMRVITFSPPGAQPMSAAQPSRLLWIGFLFASTAMVAAIATPLLAVASRIII